jgi:GNAT superfamily N-acetyltransferase
MFEISTDPARVQLDVVYPWLRDSYWSTNVRRDVVERAFANSIVAGAYRVADGRQIGVARAVTDQATFAYLADVFVEESARGCGIASQLVKTLLDDPRVATLRRWLLATRDAHAVYRPLGFEPVEPAIWMQYLLDPARWR